MHTKAPPGLTEDGRVVECVFLSTKRSPYRPAHVVRPYRTKCIGKVVFLWHTRGGVVLWARHIIDKPHSHTLCPAYQPRYLELEAGVSRFGVYL